MHNQCVVKLKKIIYYKNLHTNFIKITSMQSLLIYKKSDIKFEIEREIYLPFVSI